MSSLREKWTNIWTSIRQTPAKIPARVTIRPSQVDRGASMGGAFEPKAHYFQVRVNEMFLTAGREWLTRYDPMVFVVSEFTYDKKVETVPFIVGPSMMEKFGQKIPQGMIFSNTRVAGLHPYQGGRLTLSIVLCRVKRQDYARGLLQMLESVASVIDFSTALTTYVKVAGVVLDGVETLFGLGDTEPLIGVRTEFDPDAGDPLRPSYFALIDKPESEIEPSRLWVRDNKLLYGESLAEAIPFREADYVLYSLVHTSKRTDEAILPFYPLYEQVLQAATNPDEGSWKRAKANMLTLYQALVLSPDLTPKQADALYNHYLTKMKQMRARVVSNSTPLEN